MRLGDRMLFLGLFLLDIGKRKGFMILAQNLITTTVSIS